MSRTIDSPKGQLIEVTGSGAHARAVALSARPHWRKVLVRATSGPDGWHGWSVWGYQ